MVAEPNGSGPAPGSKQRLESRLESALVLDLASVSAIHAPHAAWRKQLVQLWKPRAFACDDRQAGGRSFHENHPDALTGRRMEQNVGILHERQDAAPGKRLDYTDVCEDIAEAATRRGRNMPDISKLEVVSARE